MIYTITKSKEYVKIYSHNLLSSNYLKGNTILRHCSWFSSATHELTYFAKRMVCVYNSDLTIIYREFIVILSAKWQQILWVKSQPSCFKYLHPQKLEFTKAQWILLIIYLKKDIFFINFAQDFQFMTMLFFFWCLSLS